jgi:hypothetical protein
MGGGGYRKQSDIEHTIRQEGNTEKQQNRERRAGVGFSWIFESKKRGKPENRGRDVFKLRHKHRARARHVEANVQNKASQKQQQ